MNRNEDFWPDVDLGAEIETPLAILKTVAAQLGEKTRRLVTAEVQSDVEHGQFRISMSLFAPAIQYSYDVLHLKHGLNPFPLVLFPDVDLGPTGISRYQGVEVTNAEELRRSVREVLGSREVVRAVGAMLAQVRS
jgi:hypothetical protein